MELWHQMEIDEIFRLLNSSKEGLSSEEASKRLQEFGPNELEEKKKRSPILMLLQQFTDFLIIVLIGAAIVAGFVGKLTDSLTIIAIVILNAIIGFIQEYKAEKALEALKKIAAPFSVALRDKNPLNIPASQLVPGDVVLLEAGQIVPADMRLIEAVNLKVEEATLTGESVPVEKHTKPIFEKDIPLGDRKNMVYQGTIITYGRGKGIVTATGMNTEMGKIASMMQQAETVKTPLQKRLAIFGRKLAIAILIISFIIFLMGLLRNEDVILMLLTSISLAVAAIPEALPAVITISLALGAKKMVKQKALIRKLPAVETLGSVTYICSDKTGTLTMNKMTVECIYLDDKIITRNNLWAKQGDETFRLIMHALALCNDAKKDKEGNLLGDPTETALYAIAEHFGFRKEDLEQNFPRVLEIPFDSDRKCMTTLHKVTDNFCQDCNYVSFTKGGAEIIIEKAEFIFKGNDFLPLDSEEILKISEQMAEEGLRVLAVGMKKWKDLPQDSRPDNMESGLILLGLIGIIDPPREEAKESIDMCKSAGIVPVMITGDHPLTAKAIARRIGILENNDEESIITGRELENLSMSEFEEKVEKIRVYARVAPEHKYKIVKALQDKGHIVAMTGDGVNDAPALKQADIGVAMGITGTEVSKEASAMILLDDNFATIVKAVREGRRIYDNILKFIKYSMTSNAGTVWAIFLAPFLGLPLPLLPIQILWMNLLCDSLPGLSLTAEPAETDAMKRPPRDPQEGVFSKGRGLFIISFGLIIGLITLLFQSVTIKMGMPWQTMVFTALVTGRMAVVIALRSEKELIIKRGFLTNRPLMGAVLLTLGLQLAVVYIPALNTIFHTTPLSHMELFLTLATGLCPLLAIEMEKLIKSFRT
ncbi:MAG: cation-translocating P-type ATPase [Thermodesulforhabdaceae bacterium]